MKGTQQSNRVLRLLFWEATIKCNLRGAHCRRLESNETAFRDLSTAQAENMVKQLVELGRKQTSMPALVFSGGEPLCRDDLFGLIACAKGLGIIPALATNGTLIDAGLSERIANSGIARVAVSLDGATAEVHDRLRKMEGAFQKAIEGIRHLRDKGLSFQINITLTKNNSWQLEDVYELARTLGAAALCLCRLAAGRCWLKRICSRLKNTSKRCLRFADWTVAASCRFKSPAGLITNGLSGSRVCTRSEQKSLNTTLICRAGADTAALPGDVWRGLAFYLYATRGTYFPAAICP